MRLLDYAYSISFLVLLGTTGVQAQPPDPCKPSVSKLVEASGFGSGHGRQEAKSKAIETAAEEAKDAVDAPACPEQCPDKVTSSSSATYVAGSGTWSHPSFSSDADFLAACYRYLSYYDCKAQLQAFHTDAATLDKGNFNVTATSVCTKKVPKAQIIGMSENSGSYNNAYIFEQDDSASIESEPQY